MCWCVYYLQTSSASSAICKNQAKTETEYVLLKCKDTGEGRYNTGQNQLYTISSSMFLTRNVKLCVCWLLNLMDIYKNLSVKTVPTLTGFISKPWLRTRKRSWNPLKKTFFLTASRTSCSTISVDILTKAWEENQKQTWVPLI